MIRKLIGSSKIIEQTIDNTFNLDTILLAKFLDLSYKVTNVLDVGTGNGALMLYLSEQTQASIKGVEIQKERYLLACKNIELNHLEERLECLLGDYLDTNFKSLDCIICNPPFFKTNNKKQLNDANTQTIARHEISLTFDDLARKVSEQLKYGGYFYFIHRPERIAEIIITLKQYQLVVKRIRFVHPYLNQKPNHVLIQCIKNGKDNVKVEAPLVIYDSPHQFSQQFLDYIGDEELSKMEMK